MNTTTDAPMIKRVVWLNPSCTVTFFATGGNGTLAKSHEKLMGTILSRMQLKRSSDDNMENRGAVASLIKRLPVSSVENPYLLPEDCRACSICLSNYEKDEERKLLPCLHGFHTDCIDKWLSGSATCPICNFELKDH